MDISNYKYNYSISLYTNYKFNYITNTISITIL